MHSKDSVHLKATICPLVIRHHVVYPLHIHNWVLGLHLLLDIAFQVLLRHDRRSHCPLVELRLRNWDI